MEISDDGSPLHSNHHEEHEKKSDTNTPDEVAQNLNTSSTGSSNQLPGELPVSSQPAMADNVSITAFDMLLRLTMVLESLPLMDMI